MPAQSRICIIEDDESLRIGLVSLLRSFGYEAEGYGSAEDYLDKPDPAPPACLITDIHLPGLSGLELTRQLRSTGNIVPIIMITARPEPMLEEKARTSGAVCLLRKPFEADALVECLVRALDMGRA